MSQAAMHRILVLTEIESTNILHAQGYTMAQLHSRLLCLHLRLQAFCCMKCNFCMLMPMQRPRLLPPCPGSKMLASSTFFLNSSLMTS